MKVVPAVVASLVLLAIGVPAAGARTGSAGLQDSVTGEDLLDGVGWRFDVHSGTAGEAPRGQVTLVSDHAVVSDVTCLAVTGNRAVIGVTARALTLPSIWVIEDNGPGASDRFGMVAGDGTVGYSCTNPPTPVMDPLQSPLGNLTVGDDQAIPATGQYSCTHASRRATAAQKRRCAKLRKARASCVRAAKRARPRAKSKRRLAACRRADARRRRA
jgi:hypothetical protein